MSDKFNIKIDSFEPLIKTDHLESINNQIIE